MATYYMATEDLKHITSDSWKDLHRGDGIELRIHSGEVDRDEAYEGLEWLDARQMYEIADKAPAWDCFAPDFYDDLARQAGVNLYAYKDLESFMDAVKEALDK